MADGGAAREQPQPEFSFSPPSIPLSKDWAGEGAGRGFVNVWAWGEPGVPVLVLGLVRPPTGTRID